jgi:hypothetical protein
VCAMLPQLDWNLYDKDLVQFTFVLPLESASSEDMLTDDDNKLFHFSHPTFLESLP